MFLCTIRRSYKIDRPAGLTSTSTLPEIKWYSSGRMQSWLQTVDVSAAVVLTALLLCVYVPLARAQLPAGSLSIDCGSNTSYTDPTYNITWVPDEPYIYTGQNYDLPSISDSVPLQSLRYFPGNKTKYCYVLPATPNQTYMVRATFFYYDFLSSASAAPPSFNLEIEAELVAGLDFAQTNNVTTYEVYMSATSVNIYVCLARLRPTDTSVPFISSLELRPLDTATMYTVVQTAGVYMTCIFHVYLGNWTQNVIRYPYDKYDRLWSPAFTVGFEVTEAAYITTTSPVNVSGTMDMVPEIVMQNVAYWSTYDLSYQATSIGLGSSSVACYLALYFAEIDPRAVNESRVFDFVVNGELSLGEANISIVNLTGGLYRAYEMQKTHVMLNDTSTIELVRHTDSVLGPILNGLELFQLTGKVGLRTFAADASAIEAIKHHFNLTSWTGDPCVYTPYDWTKCTTDPSPRITAVMLSNLNLTGSIPGALRNLSALTILWLDHNSLVGTIPDSLSALTNLQSLRLNDNEITGSIPAWLTSLNLTNLDLSDNNLTGAIPSGLLQDRNLTYFNYSGNLCLGPNGCAPSPAPVPTTGPSHKNKSNIPAIIGATVGGLLVVTAITLVLVRHCRRPHDDSDSHSYPFIAQDESNSTQVAKRYSLREIIDATNNFEKILGEGGFARVYYGKLADGKEVAVKKLILNILREEDSQFFNEVRLLSQVHHKNLVSLVGYCQEGREQILIYEYMSNGTIRESLYGTPQAISNPLDWRTRLNIALNAAQGLEYLHKGCSHQIIHRDVKTSNILLSDKMVAKVADFGLSKMTMEDDASHISTVVKGTAGYLDPEYWTKQQLTHKSDVFSFGIVLLELICGRPPINKLLHDENQWNIGQWVTPYVESGDIHAIVDKALNNDFKLESMWKVLETAMSSIKPTNLERPTMQEVVCDLKKAIEIEEKAKSLDVSYETFNDSSNRHGVGSNSPTFSNMPKSSTLFPR